MLSGLLNDEIKMYIIQYFSILEYNWRYCLKIW